MSYAFQQCKNFENRLKFDKFTEYPTVGTFLRQRNICEKCFCHFYSSKIVLSCSLKLISVIGGNLERAGEDYLRDDFLVGVIQAISVKASHVVYIIAKLELTGLGSSNPLSFEISSLSGEMST